MLFRSVARGWEELRWAGALGTWGGWRRRKVKSSPGDLAQVPRWSPWVLSSVHPTLIPATQTLGVCTSLFPLVLPVLCQDTSSAPLQPSQSSFLSMAPFFPYFNPTVAVLCPFLSQSHREVGARLTGTSQSLEPGNYPGNGFPIHSSLSARR